MFKKGTDVCGSLLSFLVCGSARFMMMKPKRNHDAALMLDGSGLDAVYPPW
ncbi:hypothetical protein [Paenibacillus gallinarum]|uniref:hypothetical protein n=1 Tax=Paenibacillus gallinarum TaxID=2762232 RepID=UPI00177FC75C|nr:hypothetical protein [Paenibacillus gallinarum]